ncbi:MAG: hypothetical protein J1F18_09585 [Lachnospiraceae bacterium]|nr:hypothetical protein [Lachnospiraceae bacterium]
MINSEFKNKMTVILSHLCIILGALLFGIFCATGNQDIFDTGGWWGYSWTVIGYGLFFWLVLEFCYQISLRLLLFGAPAPKKDYLKWGFLTFMITVAVDCVFLLVYYPGVMTYDSFIQMCQVTGGFPYSNHHPWLHTMMIKGIYEFGLWLFHNANKAYALYGIVSIGMLAFAFACIISYLRQKGLKIPCVVILMLLYITSPINQMYSITMWKDIPFAVFIVLFIILLCAMKDCILDGQTNRLGWILFVPISFGVCFFRSNGLYVFLGMIPFVMWGFWCEKKRAILAIGTVLLLGILYKGPVFHYFQVSEPDTIESLSVPAQQVAAVFYYGGKITEEQKDLLSNVVDLNQIAEAYGGSPECSDAVKDLVREKDNQSYITENKGEFIKLYLDLFRANKRIYVKGFINETCGYWYYKKNSPHLLATYIENNGMGIRRDSKAPDLIVTLFNGYLQKCKDLFNRYCIIGFNIYIFFIAFIIALQQRSRYVLSYIPILGVWGTLLLATPVNANLRYAYAIYISVPMLVCLSFHNCDDVTKVTK